MALDRVERNNHGHGGFGNSAWAELAGHCWGPRRDRAEDRRDRREDRHDRAEDRRDRREDRRDRREDIRDRREDFRDRAEDRRDRAEDRRDRAEDRRDRRENRRDRAEDYYDRWEDWFDRRHGVQLPDLQLDEGSAQSPQPDFQIHPVERDGAVALEPKDYQLDVFATLFGESFDKYQEQLAS